jgi:polyisoprenyl-phosphate glycosyltransferase
MSIRFETVDRSRAIPPTLSVVVPLYNEQESLPELIRRVWHVLDSLTVESELVLINDGSHDRTATMLDGLAAADSRIIVVHFSRNFGHQAAVSAGLAQSRGEAVVVLDGDLQDPPELIPDMLLHWRNGAEVVYAVRERRQARLLKRLAYSAFYRLLRRTCEIDIPLDSGDFGLMDRAVVDAMLALPERSRFVRGLRAFVGFRQIGIRYHRPDREAGTTKYPLRKLIRLAVDGLFDFSSFPIQMVGWSAAILMVAAVFAGVSAGMQSSATLGIVAVILAVGSSGLAGLTVIGEYVRKIFVEVKGRPTYIVSRIERSEESESPTRTMAAKAVSR